MGYVTAMSPCIGCKRVFSYNPMRVPSCSAVTAVEPICEIIRAGQATPPAILVGPK